MEDLVLKGYYNIACGSSLLLQVVEDLVLKGYYNVNSKVSPHDIVVEDLVLKGYYNNYYFILFLCWLWKTLF